jgi:hypothetical protein
VGISEVVGGLEVEVGPVEGVDPGEVGNRVAAQTEAQRPSIAVCWFSDRR